MATDPAMKPFVIGIDLGGTNVRAAVLERATENVIGRSDNIPSLAMDGPDITIGQVAEAAFQAIAAAKISKDDLIGVGVAVPGVVKSSEGLVSYAPNFRDQWRGVPIAKPLADKLGVPVWIGNDANLATLGEYRFGAGRPVRHMVMLTLGTGVGGGVIIDGKLLEGADGGAGELGHMIINPGGRGGNAAFGTLEGEAQISAVVERATRIIQSGRRTIIAQMCDYDRFALTPKIIAEAAEAGDAAAIEVFEETGYLIGVAAGSLINIFNPQMIVIGGGVAQAGNLILDPIRRTAAATGLRILSRNCQIVGAQLGDNAGIFGAAALVLQKVAGES